MRAPVQKGVSLCWVHPPSDRISESPGSTPLYPPHCPPFTFWPLFEVQTGIVPRRVPRLLWDIYPGSCSPNRAGCSHGWSNTTPIASALEVAHSTGHFPAKSDPPGWPSHPTPPSCSGLLLFATLNTSVSNGCHPPMPMFR
eukprot:EG_transcript_30317